VLWLEDGARFFCGRVCTERFLLGECGFDETTRQPVEAPRATRPSIPDLVREATVTREAGEDVMGDGTKRHRYDPFAAAGIAVIAAGLVILWPGRETAWLGASLIVLSAAVNARIPLSALRASPSLRVVAPVGLALAAVAAALTTDPQTQKWALLGAAAAAFLVSIRNGIHASLIGSMRAAARDMAETLPTRARVPTHDPLAYEEVSSDDLRQGDLAVVLEGEHAPADGVIEEGDCLALRYPGAAQARPYGEQEFILAGTQVLEGAITLRVRRTGKDRALARAIELGQRKRQDRAVPSRLRFIVTRWSWLALAPAAVALLVWAGPAAAATLLLGAPVLALLASLDVPLDAGALAAAQRGMFFGSSRALRDAGRAKTTAILLRGALTAGEPIVQQALPLGGMDLDHVLALAAAAESIAEDHPIAGAIRRYASEHVDSTALVRKERALAGLGVTAVTSHGVPVVVGRRQLLLDEGISIAGADADATHIENEGLAPIFIAVDGRLEALIAVLDPTHVGARDAIGRIADLPCEVVILSGDDRRTVERIAAQLGAPHVKAPLLPHERVQEVRSLRESGGVIATIGRGGNDDAVLAAADVPVSLRLAGSALEDRGVAIASRDVRDAAGALWLARAVRRATWRSIGACAAATVVVAVGAALGWMTPIAAAFMASATEAWALRAGPRLLRRVDLRVPMKQ
jgi:P-type E1-E2 ATPase